MLSVKIAFHFLIQEFLVFEFRFQEFAVQAGNVCDGNTFGAFHFASAGIRAVAEAQFVHFGHHGLGATRCFDFSLRQ